MTQRPKLTALKGALMLAIGTMMACTAQAEDTAIFPMKSPVPRMKAGPIEFRPHFKIQSEYNDNVFISETNERDDLIWTASPGLTIGVGDYVKKEESYLEADYTPNLIYFTNLEGEDAVDHRAYIKGQHRFQKLYVKASHRYIESTGANNDIGNRVKRSVQNPSLLLSYDISDKTEVGLEGKFTHTDYKDQLDSNEWLVGPYLDHQIMPKLNIGAGVNMGFLDVEGATPNQTYQQFLFRFDWDVTGKINAHGNVGGEYRQYDGPNNVSDRFSPVFGVGASYDPFKNTSFSFDLYRRTTNSSSIPGVNYTTTGFNSGITQRVFQKVVLGLKGGFDNSDYNDTVTHAAGDREDNYFFIRPSVSVDLTEWWSASVYYECRKNDSDVAGNDFDNNRIGLESSVRF